MEDSTLLHLLQSSPTPHNKPFIILLLQLFLYGFINCLFQGFLMFSLNLYLPLQIIQLFGDEYKSIALGILSAITALGSTLITLITGYFIDKYQLPRIPFIIISIILFCIFTLLRTILFSDIQYRDWINDPLYWYCAVCIITLFITISKMSFSITNPLYSAIMIDHFPTHSFAIASSITGLFALVGTIYGTIIPGFILNQFKLVYIVLCYCVISMVACVLLFIAFPEVKKYSFKKIQENTSNESSWTVFVTPFQNWNFRWLFIAKFSIMLAGGLQQSFSLYFLKDLIGHSHNKFNLLFFTTTNSVEEANSILNIGMILCLTIGVALSPFLSKGMGIIPLLSITTVTSAMTNIVNLIALDMNWCMFMQCIQGFCIGTFLSLEIVLLNQNLPNKKEIVKDLAIMSITMNIPQIIAGPIGGFILQFGNTLAMNYELVYPYRYLGYYLLFCEISVLQILGAISILFLKKEQQ